MRQQERLTLTHRERHRLEGREEQRKLVNELCKRVQPLTKPRERHVTWNELLGWVEVK